MANKVLCVLGMRRSGTSAITGVLQCLGVELGRSLMAGHSGVNDLGYFEHEEIVDVHDRLFAVLNSHWDDIRPLEGAWWTDGRVEPFRCELAAIAQRDFRDTPVWGLKDPRMCRLVRLWFDIFDQVDTTPLFLHMLRQPREVAGSLGKRDGFDSEKSALLWLDHNLTAERHSRGHPRVFVSYDQLLSEPGATLARIGQQLQLSWPHPLKDTLPRIESFLSPQLRHHAADDGTVIRGPHEALAAKTYDKLVQVSAAAPNEAVLDELDREFKDHIAGFDPALVNHLSDVMTARVKAETEVKQILASPSWFLTKPLRFVQRLAAR